MSAIAQRPPINWPKKKVCDHCGEEVWPTGPPPDRALIHVTTLSRRCRAATVATINGKTTVP